MSVILPSRLSWALSDRPSRSKGMWFGILGAFVAGIAVAGVAGSMPKVEAEASIKPEKAPVAVKVTPPKMAAPEPQVAAVSNTPKIGSKPERNEAIAKAVAEASPAPTVAASEEVKANEKPDQAVRVIGADRITPPPGATEGPPVNNPPPATVEKPASVTPALETAEGRSEPAASPTTPAFIANSHEFATAEPVPMPRDKPASLVAQGRIEAPEPAINAGASRPGNEDTGVAAGSEIPPSATNTAQALIEGPVPMPRVKPAIQEALVETAMRPEAVERSAGRTAKLDDEDVRSVRAERRTYDRRPASIDSRSEMRRIERAEARAAQARARETQQRNEDEGFELVHSYRGRDGRRVSVYRRMEPRIATYRARPLFGRPAFLLPPRGFW